jgi:hypothetical protein
MIRLFDLYGSRELETDSVRDLVQEALGVPFHAHSSNYVGDYYVGSAGSAEKISIRPNELEDEDGRFFYESRRPRMPARSPSSSVNPRRDRLSPPFRARPSALTKPERRVTCAGGERGAAPQGGRESPASVRSENLGFFCTGDAEVSRSGRERSRRVRGSRGFRRSPPSGRTRRCRRGCSWRRGRARSGARHTGPATCSG